MITVLDRSGPEAASYECETVKAAYDRLLGAG
jgi:hypothetical protein